MDKNELKHYGVIGMKWGRRKASYYQGKSDKHASKIGTSRTRLGKNYHNRRSAVNEVKALKKKSVSEKGALKLLDNAYGTGGYGYKRAAESKYRDRKSKYVRTRLAKTVNESSAYSNKNKSDSLLKIHNSKSGTQAVNRIIKGALDTKIKGWGGRQTTTGKRWVDKMFTLGLVGDAANLNYYIKNRKK